MNVSDAVTAVAAFVGGYLGQRQATGELAQDVRALRAQVARLDERVRNTRGALAGLWHVVRARVVRHES
jgi:outer membrane murein-binding lipoprotein Lpp